MLSYVTFLICFLSSATYLQSTKHKVIATDIDLQTCITNFDVHTDKIIRTQDSRNMGAKYLNEMDLDSREECLRLCCETENCDVFVYEEKSTGSCYLFECGPPEDFKCKFTHHANYTSAVLAVSRHMSNLENQIKLTKHENDLTKLRVPEVHTVHEIKEPDSLQKTSSPLPTTVQPQILTTLTTKPNNQAKERRCSRYQFECRSTGECIAIYNACDGIAQCADGSDEGPELNCPELTTTLRPLLQQHRVQNNNNQNGERRELPLYPEQQYRTSYPKQAIQIPPNQEYNPEGDFLRPVPVFNIRNSEHQPVPYDNNRQLPYQNNPVENSNNWMPHSTNLVDAGKNTRIYNHMEIQPSQVRYVEPEGRGGFPPYHGDTYQNPVGYQAPSWNIQQENVISSRQYDSDIKTKSNQANSENWHEQQQNSPNDKKIQITQDHSVTSPLHQKSNGVQPQESEKLAHDLKNSKHFMKTEDVPKEAIKERVLATESEHAYKSEKDFVDVARFKVKDTDPDDLEDGFAQTPGGAALSLTLGLIITCVMAILIACRLRVVRRRIRKGGKGYAHDADYLVNGMYL